MDFPSPLVRGTLVRRYRRFLADVDVPGEGTRTCHCPTPSGLRGCSEPGHTVLLSSSPGPGRRHSRTWELTEIGDTLIAVNAPLCRRMLLDAIGERQVPGLTGFDTMETDVTVGTRAPMDILLHGLERNTFIQVFQITWAEERRALFPEAPSPRARAGLRRLTDLAAAGHRAVGFFLVQRSDCTAIAPAVGTDRDLPALLDAARRTGVELRAHGTRVSRSGVELGPGLPWEGT